MNETREVGANLPAPPSLPGTSLSGSRTALRDQGDRNPLLRGLVWTLVAIGVLGSGIWAAQKQIMIATPASLIALLRAVSVSWQQHAQTENAREIAASAQELFERVLVFSKHFEKIRGGLEQASKAYNDAVGSYESRVRPSGEKLLKLGGDLSGKALAETAPVDTMLRLPPS